MGAALTQEIETVVQDSGCDSPQDRALPELFTNDDVLPSQFWTRRRAEADPDTEGAFQLLACILADAVNTWKDGIDFPETTQRGHHARDEADWLFNSAHRSHITFDYVCEIFGVDPDWLRKRIATRGVNYSYPHNMLAGSRTELIGRQRTRR